AVYARHSKRQGRACGRCRGGLRRRGGLERHLRFAKAMGELLAEAAPQLRGRGAGATAIEGARLGGRRPRVSAAARGPRERRERARRLLLARDPAGSLRRNQTGGRQAREPYAPLAKDPPHELISRPRVRPSNPVSSWARRRSRAEPGG